MVLRAVILVGGFGTRLRPLTFSTPKPMIEFCNKPIVVYQVEELAQAGVEEIVLCVSYKPKILERYLSRVAEILGIRIVFSVEDEPLDTAGPLALAKEYLDPNDPDPFFMMNADVIADYQFKELLEFHRNSGGEGTIYVTEVEDPTRFGVVAANDEGLVSGFHEKPPDDRFGNKINAGLYIFNKEILNRIELRPTSIEREIFPAMARDGKMFRKVLPSLWMDVGKPDDFLACQILKLNELSVKRPDKLSQGNNVIGNCLIHDEAQIDETALIGPNVVIGPGVIVGPCARVSNSTILQGTVIEQAAFVDGSIVGWKCRVGRWARLQKLCVLGEDVKIKEGKFLRAVKVCPHKSVKEDAEDTIVM